MPPELSFDLLIKLFSVVVFPLSLIINLKLRKAAADTMATSMWRNWPGLMWASMAMLTTLTAFTTVDLMAHFGIIPSRSLDASMPYIGIPMGLAALWVLFETGRFIYAKAVAHR